MEAWDGRWVGDEGREVVGREWAGGRGGTEGEGGRGREGWVGAPLWEILNTPLLIDNGSHAVLPTIDRLQLGWLTRGIHPGVGRL